MNTGSYGLGCDMDGHAIFIFAETEGALKHFISKLVDRDDQVTMFARIKFYPEYNLVITKP